MIKHPIAFYAVLSWVLCAAAGGYLMFVGLDITPTSETSAFAAKGCALLGALLVAFNLVPLARHLTSPRQHKPNRPAAVD
jgi:hypothetical protein